MIAWTEELRAKIFSTRENPNANYLPTILGQISSVKPNRYPLDVDDSYDKMRDWDHAAEIARVRKGLDDAPPALRSITERAIEERKRKKAPEGPLDVDVEAAMIALDIAHAWSAAPYWVAKEGVAFALRALVRAHSFEPSHYEHGYGSGKIWIVENWRFASQCDSGHAWYLLRGCIALADDRAYAEARRVAEELRASVPLCVRAQIAFAFPTETAWGNADAEGALAAGKSWEGDSGMLLTVADSELAARLARTWDGSLDDDWLATIIARHGEDATRVIHALIESASRGDERKQYAKMLAVIASVDTAKVFASLLTNKAVAPVAEKYFKAHPELSRDALASAATGSGKIAAAASLALENVTPNKVATKASVTKPAKNGAIPGVLASPPWKTKRAAPIVIDGLVEIAFKPRIVWAKGERERLRAELDAWERKRAAKGCVVEASTDDKLIKWLSQKNGMPMFWVARITDTKRAMQLFETQRVSYWWSGPQRSFPMLLAAHGLATLPGFLRFGESRAAEGIDALARFVTPAVAPFMADVRVRLKSVRAVADRWLVENADVAAIALVPRAVGKIGKARESAESALLYLRDHDRDDVVTRVAARYGKEAKRAIAAIDPRLAFPAKLPKLPPFANARALPPPELLAKKGALDEGAVESLLTMLAFYNSSAPYVGIDQVKAACTPESLRAFAWALFERWLAAGAPPKESWALEAVGVFGDDAIVSDLAAKIRAWPKERAMARASLGLEILGRIGTDLALSHIDSISRRFRFASIQRKAFEMINDAATRRGLSQDELADRVAPDLDGASIDQPMKRDVKAIVTQQIERLERAMCGERTWSASEFDAFIRNHKLVGQLARRLLFSAQRGATRILFRIAEDGSLADHAEKAITIAKDARVAIVHRLRLSDDEVTRWSTIFADYEILQPFEQLARATFSPPKDFGAGLALDPGRVRGLAAHGWESDGDSWIGALSKSVGGALVTIRLEPGFSVSGKDVEPQKIQSIKAAIPMRRIDALAFSELRREIDRS